MFQPNFRGSTNRDDAFRRAGNGEWGAKMQTDLSDGLRALADKGIVDPKRACIVGASYGGYAALAGVTLQHGIYRCAVAVAGVSDLGDMYAEDYRESGEAKISKVRLIEQLGPKDRWADRSPRRHAAEADAPILLIHGKDDTVVPYSHTARMADALKDAHKPYEVVTLPGEDHWLSRAAEPAADARGGGRLRGKAQPAGLISLAKRARLVGEREAGSLAMDRVAEPVAAFRNRGRDHRAGRAADARDPGQPPAYRPLRQPRAPGASRRAPWPLRVRERGGPWRRDQRPRHRPAACAPS